MNTLKDQPEDLKAHRAAEIAEVDWELTPEEAEDQACFRRGWEAAVRLFRPRHEALVAAAREEGKREGAHRDAADQARRDAAHQALHYDEDPGRGALDEPDGGADLAAARAEIERLNSLAGVAAQLASDRLTERNRFLLKENATLRAQVDAARVLLLDLGARHTVGMHPEYGPRIDAWLASLPTQPEDKEPT